MCKSFELFQLLLTRFSILKMKITCGDRQVLVNVLMILTIALAV